MGNEGLTGRAVEDRGRRLRTRATPATLEPQSQWTGGPSCQELSRATEAAVDHKLSRLGSPQLVSSLSSRVPSWPSMCMMLVALGVRRFEGGRAPGGADVVNERSLSACCRNEDEVSVLVCFADWLHGS